MIQITVAIVAHNEECRIARCLESLFRQDFPLRQIHILVIDNGSRDKTAAVARQWLQANDHQSWRVVELSENHLGRARATAVTLAHGPWLAFLDTDCEPPTTWLSDCSRFLSRHQLNEKVAAVSPALIFPLGESPFAMSRSAFNQGWLAHLGSPQTAQTHRDRRVEHLPTAGIVFLREAVLDVGNFSPRFDRVCEDVELCLRLTRSGYALYQLSSPPVIHHQKEGWASWLARMWRYGYGQIAARGPRPWTWPPRLRLVGVSIPLGAATLLISPTACGAVALVYFFALLGTAWRAQGAAAPLRHVGSGTCLLAVTHVTYALAFSMSWLVHGFTRLQQPPQVK